MPKRINTLIIKVPSLDMTVPEMDALLKYTGFKRTPFRNIKVVSTYPYEISVASYINKYNTDNPKFRKMRRQIFRVIHHLIKRNVDIEFVRYTDSMQMLKNIDGQLYIELIAYLLKIKGR